MADTPDPVLRIATLKFPLGQLVTTPNALENITHEDILIALNRHAVGDWGTLESHDWEANERALQDGGRLFSIYFSQEKKTKFYVITEADRSYTAILLPEDY